MRGSAAVCALTLILLPGCSLFRRDDGATYTSDLDVLRVAMEAVQSARAMVGGGSIDWGEGDKIVAVHVSDTRGQPVPGATMDVRLYFSGRLYGEWSGLRASITGDFEYFAPESLGPPRTEILVVRAEGYAPRMIKRPGARRSDPTRSIAREEWEVRSAEFAAGIPTLRGVSPATAGRPYREGQSIRICPRVITLHKIDR